MAATELEICNAALSRLGAPAITSLSDADKKSQTCSLMYPRTRDNLLRSHPWNFALKRVELLPYVGTVNYGTDVITTTVAPATGTKISFYSSSNGVPSPLQTGVVYYAINLNATTFKVALTYADSLVPTPIDLVDDWVVTSFYFGLVPAFGYSMQFPLPTDYLRVVKLDPSDIEYKIEGSYLLCNDSSVNMLYVSKITDVTKYEAMFDHLLSVMLAHEMSYSLVQSVNLKNTLAQEVQILLRDVRSADAQEGTPDDFDFNTWLEARY